VPACFLEAELALARNDAPAALAAVDRALASSDGLEDSEGYVLRARAFEMCGEDGRAREDLDRALELDPDAPDARRERGRLRLLAGHAGPAAADLERAVHLAPRDTEARLLRGRARVALGQLELAREDAAALAAEGVALPPELGTLLGSR
jgi:tetratricopeptide (TPR) repeat protein